jgi:hypothetical protein
MTTDFSTIVSGSRISKTTLKCLILALVVSVGGMTLLAGDALAADEAMPAEVKALIGMKFPPLVIGKAAAHVPRLVVKDGEVMRNDNAGGVLALDLGLFADKWPILVAEKISKERAMEITDVLMLPQDLIDWRLINGKFEGVAGRFDLSTHCRANDEDHRIILALDKPEKGNETCEHYTKRLHRAWLVDEMTGRIRKIPTEGLSCHYLAEDPC